MISTTKLFLIAAASLLVCWVHPVLAVEELPAGMAYRMIDPAIDEKGPFCYLAKPTNQLAMIASNRVVQVTFDGAIYTGGCEFVLLHGDPLQPIMVRQKENMLGWIPIINYHWIDGSIEFAAEAFVNTLDGNPQSNNIAFVKVTARNEGNAPELAKFGAVTRFVGDDHRFKPLKTFSFSPAWSYEMTADTLIRDGRIIVEYPQPASMEAVPGVPYTGPFAGGDFKIVENAEVGLLRYEVQIEPGKSRSFVFKIPTDPIVAGGDEAGALRAAKYDHFRQRTIAFWKAQLGQGAQISIPEKKVLEAHNASLMYPMQAIYLNRDGDWMQGVNKFHYRGFWLRDAAYIIHAYDVWGQHDIARNVLAVYPSYQRDNGLFMSQEGQLDGFGQALYAMGQHAIITQNRTYAEQIYPMFPRAFAWLKQARAEDPLRLMPSTAARDNELILGHYTGHNFWALLGLRTAARIALMTDRKDDAKLYLAEYNDLHETLMKKIGEVSGTDGYIPPGLDAEGGQDWGNLIGLYPTEVLDVNDPRVAATAQKMHADKFSEGLMTYRYALHHYLTVKEAQNHIIQGEQELALRDFYALLLHMGSANEMFEWQAVPWGDRDVRGNYTPHGWGAAMYNLMLRNMLVQERGGDGGMALREIHLFSVISPEWAAPGKKITMRDMPTEIGTISAAIQFGIHGAEIDLQPRFSTEPQSIVIHVPYFAELQSVKANENPIRIEGDSIVFSPNVRTITLLWKTREVEPLSFEHTVATYRNEYRERYEQYISAGNKPLAIEAPPLMTAEKRAEIFDGMYANSEPGVLVGGKVTTSSEHESMHRPEFAVDGNAWEKDSSAWWVGPPAPQWLSVELPEPKTIDRLRVYPYWDDHRYYQYVVDVSKDGNDWTRVVDMSQNTNKSTPAGDLFKFNPIEARHVKITMLHNSANTSMHLVEIKAFEAEQ